MTSELVIDSEAFAGNLATIRARVAPASHMLVVKDDAYGHGLVEVVSRAWAEGVRWFGAFDVDTGCAVRDVLGEEADIFVWIVASDAALDRALAHSLHIGVGDPSLLEEVAAASARTARAAAVHLKIDTGLHRNGVRPEEWPAFVGRAAELEDAGRIDVVGIWSHIAEASDDEDDASRDLFDSAVAVAEEAGLRPRLRHLAASAASFARPEFRYDLVRVGAFAFGIRPAGGPGAAALGIRPIARLIARVTAVRPEDVEVGIGALHGLPSPLAGQVEVGTPGGSRRLLKVEDHACRVERWDGAVIGDEIAVYGTGGTGEQSATGLAEALGSIGEEIAVRISPAIPRRWV